MSIAAVAEEQIVLADTHRDLVRIEGEIRDATAKHNKSLKELGLPPLLRVDGRLGGCNPVCAFCRFS